jgi:hypothetical protein
MGPGAAFYQQVLFPGPSDTAENVGTGASVFRNKINRRFYFRSLKSQTSALVISVVGDEVQFTLNFPPMLNYKGSWNANTNSPDLTTGSHAVGDAYDVSVAGTTNLDGISDWEVGDLVVRFDTGSGQAWKKFDNTDKIISVNGQVGAVALTTDDIPEGANKYYDDALVSANTDVAANTAARHVHSNFALLETYTQTNANIADAVTKRHTHANLALLHSYSQTEADLADAVNKKHTHSNYALLETYTVSNANIEAAYTHSQAGISAHSDVDTETTPPTDGQALVWYDTESKWKPGTISGGSGHVIQDEGSPLTQRSALDFVGAGVTLTDDPVNDKTIVSISGGSGGTSNIAIYDPDIAATVDNRYKTWAEVMAAVSSWGPVGGEIVVHKVGLFQNAAVPDGTYDLSNVSIVSSNASIVPGLSFADGTTLSGFPRLLEGVRILNNNTSAPLYTVSSFGLLVIRDSSVVNASSATHAAIHLSSGSNLTCSVHTGISPFFKESGGSEPIFCEGSLSLDIWRVPESSFFSQNDIFSNGLSGNGVIYINSRVLVSGGYVATHTNFDGTLNVLQRYEERVNELIGNKTEEVFYFNPDLAPGGNLYDNFDNLANAIASSTSQSIIVYFNLENGAYYVPTPNTYDFSRCVFKNISRVDTNATLDFPDGTTITQWPIDCEISMIFHNYTAPVSQTSGIYKNARFSKKAAIDNSGSQPVFRASNNGDNFEIILTEESRCNNGTLFHAASANSAIRIKLFDYARIGNVFTSVSGSMIAIEDHTLVDGGADISSYGSGTLYYDNPGEERISQVSDQRLADITWRISDTTNKSLRLFAGSSTQLLSNLAISQIGPQGPYFPRKFGFYSNLTGLTTLHGIYPGIATYIADGMVIVLENIQQDATVGTLAIEMKHNSVSGISNGKIFTQDGHSLWLYQNDKVKLRYNNNASFGPIGWHVIAVERANSFYSGAVAGITWTATVNPTVLDAEYKLRFEGGYCYLDAYIQCNGTSGTNITQIIFNMPQGTPKSGGPLGTGRIGTLVNQGADYLTGFTSACIAHAGDEAIQAAFPAISNPEFLRFSMIIPLDGPPVP